MKTFTELLNNPHEIKCPACGCSKYVHIDGDYKTFGVFIDCMKLDCGAIYHIIKDKNGDEIMKRTS